MISNYLIATLCDWLKNLAAVFQWTRGKTKTNNCTLYPFPCYEHVAVIARNSDHFNVLFAPVVIGRSNDFSITSHLKTALASSNKYKHLISMGMTTNNDWL